MHRTFRLQFKTTGSDTNRLLIIQSDWTALIVAVGNKSKYRLDSRPTSACEHLSSSGLPCRCSNHQPWQEL